MGMYENFRLDGQVAVVTGGGRGIGRGIALGLADCGADVVVIARRQADVDAVAEEIRERGQRALSISADVMDWDQIPAALDRVIEEFGRLDIMVNNAGGNLDRKMYALPGTELWGGVLALPADSAPRFAINFMLFGQEGQTTMQAVQASSPADA